MTEPKFKVAVLPLVLGRMTSALPYLALGMLVAYLRKHKDGELAEAYDIDRLLPAGYDNIPLKTIYQRVVKTPNPICLFSSYVWNHELNIKAARHIKKISPHSLIIFGGPHVPKFTGDTEDFLKENDFIDIAVLGEGEAAITEILETFADSPRQQRDLTKLDNITGLVYRSESGFSRTPERNRIRDICELPSPYLTGEFEPWFHDFSGAILETNRGCPYGCTYCDWGSATLAKVTKFTPQRVIAEMEYIASKRSEAIFIADANFGMLEQDIEIAEALVEIKARTGYPLRLFTNFAKNGGRRLMEVIKILHEGGLLPTGIIALQTTDPIVLKTIARDNIKTEAYEKMMTYFNAENIPMASDLMIGLPGQTVDSFANDLQFCFDWKVSASANYTSMMPNAPMAERSYREEHKIVSGDDDMIHSTASFTVADMDYMKALFTTYQFHVRFGILKYFLYCLQIEHGVPAITFLRRWLECAINSDPDYPVSVRVLKDIFRSSQHQDWAMMVWKDNANFLFENPEAFYDEVFQLVERDFDIKLSPSEINTLKQAQQAVMPRAGREYPYEVSLEHDIEAYINQIKTVPSLGMLEGEVKLLADWDQGKLTVTADTNVIDSTAFENLTYHSDQWELPSPIRFY
ncbi:MAG: radical SAM superfamily enzyme YgiQ (UPF0313 family) [Halioglobus sp.]|jgi:radical SAM superfamily enzyme YgiQ (UPF0313 family)